MSNSKLLKQEVSHKDNVVVSMYSGIQKKTLPLIRLLNFHHVALLNLFIWIYEEDRTRRPRSCHFQTEKHFVKNPLKNLEGAIIEHLLLNLRYSTPKQA